ncbi:hypothetical protein M3Y98_00369400 [Aphelenchoides besseyi]|nr:hypothetical protein M3Y98_00369400 [Aphelenchoides besseyi]KAI6201792.1 hypothetical protein M3Y96_00880100 [Aphelenchoides besseyi]
MLRPSVGQVLRRQILYRSSRRIWSKPEFAIGDVNKTGNRRHKKLFEGVSNEKRTIRTHGGGTVTMCSKALVLLAQNVCLREVTLQKACYNLGDFDFELHANPPYATFSLLECREPPPYRNPDAVYESKHQRRIFGNGSNYQHQQYDGSYCGHVVSWQDCDEVIVKECGLFDGFSVGTPVNVKRKIAEESNTLIFHADSIAQFEKRRLILGMASDQHVGNVTNANSRVPADDSLALIKKKIGRF